MATAKTWTGLAAAIIALAASLVLASAVSAAEPSQSAPSPSAADDIASVFSQVGNQIYDECVFELSEEQIEVQRQLIQAYMEKGAHGPQARRLAAQQIQPPKLSKKCAELQRSPAAMSSWTTALATPDDGAPAEETPAAAASLPASPPLASQAPVAAAPSAAARPSAASPPPAPQPPAAAKQPVVALAKPAPAPAAKPAAPVAPATAPASPAAAPSAPPPASLAGRKMLPQWDCAPNVDFVTITLNGFERKLTGGEICNPYQDVVREVPASVATFRLGYTIRTGRLFVVSDDPEVSGRTIAWAISGRDVCRNNPDPDCFAARAVGPLPPGEYTFSGDKANRITWGPKTKRHVAAVYLKKLWNKERFSAAHTAAILKRGNIAIHARLKGEMSEACLGLEPKGWAYVASLIKDNRATALNVYIDEPHPQVAEAPPVVEGSSFSLTSLFQ